MAERLPGSIEPLNSLERRREMSQVLNQVPTAAAKIRPLLVGATVPELSLLTRNGDPFDLNAALAEKPTILIFYRGNW